MKDSKNIHIPNKAFKKRWNSFLKRLNKLYKNTSKPWMGLTLEEAYYEGLDIGMRSMLKHNSKK